MTHLHNSLKWFALNALKQMFLWRCCDRLRNSINNSTYCLYISTMIKIEVTRFLKISMKSFLWIKKTLTKHTLVFLQVLLFPYTIIKNNNLMFVGQTDPTGFNKIHQKPGLFLENIRSEMTVETHWSSAAALKHLRNVLRLRSHIAPPLLTELSPASALATPFHTSVKATADTGHPPFCAPQGNGSRSSWLFKPCWPFHKRPTRACIHTWEQTPPPASSSGPWKQN